MSTSYPIAAFFTIGNNSSQEEYLFSMLLDKHFIIMSISVGVICEFDFSKYSLIPKECFFIDDKPCNIAAGQALGMPGHVFDGDMERLEAVWRIKKER